MHCENGKERFLTSFGLRMVRRIFLCMLLSFSIMGDVVYVRAQENPSAMVGNPEGVSQPGRGSEQVMPVHVFRGLNRDSPQATIQSFLEVMDKAYAALHAHGPRSRETLDWIYSGLSCLNMERLPPAHARHQGPELAVQLKEILDRIPFLVLDEIRDINPAELPSLRYWTIPNTKIHLARVDTGPYKDDFLFAPETIERIPEFYHRIAQLPYRDGASRDFHEDFIYAPGWMIPHQWIRMLPDWADTPFLEQNLWQWLGMVVVLVLGFLVLRAVYRWRRTSEGMHDDSHVRWRFSKLWLAVSGIVVTYVVFYLLAVQINITGRVFAVVSTGLDLVGFGFVGLAIVISGNVLIETILASPRLKARNIDANLIRLSVRVLTLLALLGLLWELSDFFGLPFNAVIASAGVMGLAVAFAARETIANFFGGLTILMDRPFKAGDYIVLSTGERGEVKEIGLRSTRIQTRDDITVCLPNSVITAGKIINESAPSPSFRVRIKVGVAYGSDIGQVEKVLIDLARKNALVSSHPEPRVRFRSFGDSSLEFELLCWITRPHERGQVIHHLNTDIYNRFAELGISIPFPQRDVHIQSSPP